MLLSVTGALGFLGYCGICCHRIFVAVVFVVKELVALIRLVCCGICCHRIVEFCCCGVCCERVGSSD